MLLGHDFAIEGLEENFPLAASLAIIDEGVAKLTRSANKPEETLAGDLQGC